MNRNFIGFRPDKETQDILDGVSREGKSISDHVRNAIKFYHQYKDSVQNANAPDRALLNKILEAVTDLSKSNEGVGPGSLPSPEVNQNKKTEEDDDFMEVFLNIGRQFETWGQSDLEEDPQMDRKLHKPDREVLADDDELEF